MSFLSDPVTFVAQWLSGVLAGWGLPAGAVQFISFVVGGFILSVIPLLFTIFLIWLERKLIGRFQDRLGPNRVGPWGLIQPFADMLKIFTKEYITPRGADKVMYNLAPILAVGGVIMIWAVVPFSVTVMGVNLSVAVLYIVAVGALGEMGIIMAGFGSNNKYALLGGFRAVAQLVSYEVPLVLTLIVPVMMAGSMGMNDIVRAQNIWYVLLAPAAAALFLIASIAENGRAPFDLLEADSELVAGFNIEYSGLKFGMFYVGDFLHTYSISLLFATLFLGGWRGPGAETTPILGFIYLFIKSWIPYFTIITLRASLPRFRIDQMLNLNWKVLTPFALAVLTFTALVYKPVQNSPWWLQLVVMLALNAVLIVAASWLVDRHTARRPRKVVAQPRPVARPETPIQPDQGAEA